MPTRQGCQAGKELKHLIASEATLNKAVTFRITAMDLEDVFGQINSNHSNLHLGWLPGW